MDDINEILEISENSQTESFKNESSIEDYKIEKTLIITANVIGICGAISVLVCFFTIVFIRQYFNPQGFVITIILLISTLISWCLLRVLANISITLKRIHNKLK